MAEYKFPTEMVELPSKGHFYADGHPLSSGKVEIKQAIVFEQNSTATRYGLPIKKVRTLFFKKIFMLKSYTIINLILMKPTIELKMKTMRFIKLDSKS